MKVKRIVTGAEFVYQDVDIICDQKVQECMGIKCFFTNPYVSQMVICTKEGDIKVISDWYSGFIEVRNMNPPINYSDKVKQIVVNYESSFTPAYIIKEAYYDKLEIPRFFEYQLSWVSDRYLYVCRQHGVVEITV